APSGSTQFAGDEAISLYANRMLVGAPGGIGKLHVYSSGATFLQTLQPFLYDTNATFLQMRLVDALKDVGATSLDFGVGGQYISEGFALAGTNNATNTANKIYDFRQRGPEWTPVAHDLLVPDEVRKSEAGSSV